MKIKSLIEGKTTNTVPATKPRNFVAKNAIQTGAGAHKDKKKAVKQGDVKHKKKAIAEGAEFGSYYNEQLAQKVFDQNPNLSTSGRADELLNAGFVIAVQDLGRKRAQYEFSYNEDFPSDFVSSYSYLQRNSNGVEEALTPLNDVQKLQQDISELFKMRSGASLTWDMLEELGITKDKWENPEMLKLLLKRINSWAHNPQTENIDEDSENTPDAVTMDVPLLIRIMEYAREEANTDMDLHNVAENLINLSSSGKTLTMMNYESIIPSDDVKESAEYDDETGMAANQLQTIQRCARDMEATLVDGENLPEWVQSKISIAKENIVTVFDYVLSQHQNGDVEMEEGMYRRPGSPTAYDRDYASSVRGMEKHQSQAYQQDGGANDEGWDKEPYQAQEDKPRLLGYYFYDVPAGMENEAAIYGVKKTKNGKWAKAKYSTSGRSYGMQKDGADKAFGPGKWWAPK